MRTHSDLSALSWLAAQLRWERVLDDLRATSQEPDPAPRVAVERPQAA
jgi:hypothetical protein